MSLLKTVAFGFAFAFVSVAVAQAATPHKKPAHHAPRHTATTHAMPHGKASTRSAVGADNSADSLNAQSLSRAQGAQ